MQVFTMLALTVLMGCLAVAADLGRLAVARGQLQNAVDAAALAAVTALRHEGMDPDAAVAAAQQTAESNQVLGRSVVLTAGDVTVGRWDPETETVTPWEVGASGAPSNLGGYIAVQVRGRMTADSPNGTIPTYFAGAVGLSEFTLRASATAGASIEYLQRPPVEMMLLLDYSASFVNEHASAVTALGAFAAAVKPVALPGPSEGMGDNMAFYGFSDQAIDSAHYPAAGWNDRVKGTGRWYQANVSQNYPVGLTRMDTPSSADSFINRFSSSTKPFYFDMNSKKRYYNGNWYQGGTNTAAGLLAVASTFKNPDGTWHNPDARRVICLVTDGMPYYFNQYGNLDANYAKAQATAAANTLAAQGFVIHTVTLCQDGGGTSYGITGSDADFNASLVRNGGFAFRSANAAELQEMIIGGVGSIEYGRTRLLK